MRLNFAVLLAVAALLTTTTSADSTEVAPQLPSNNVVATRLLRVVTVDEDDGDRGINLSVPSLESVTNLFKSPNQKKLDSLVKSGVTTDEAFSKLKLNRVSSTLLKKSNFKLWVKYVNHVATNPQTVVLSKLTSHFGGEGNLAVMLQQASRVRATQKTATYWQNVQFAQWQKEKWSTSYIIDYVLQIHQKTWHTLAFTSPERQVRKLYSDYLKAHPVSV